MKKVLVTGAAGFIGQPSVNALLERDFQVHVISSRQIKQTEPNLIWHQADLHNHQRIKELLIEIKPTYLLHLAWYVEHGVYWSSPENLKWLSSSLNLIEQFTNIGGQRIVCAGTCAEYDWDQKLCEQSLSENAQINPHTVYGNAKAGLQTALHDWCQNKNISYAWGRIFFPYGPHENPKRLIPSTILSLLAGKTMTFHNPHLKRDLSFVEDNGKIFAALTDSNIFGPVNVASGKAVKLSEAIDLIAKMLNAPNLIEYKPKVQNISEPPILYANIDRLQKELGIFPQTKLEDGLEQTINWWQQTKSNYLPVKSG